MKVGPLPPIQDHKSLAVPEFHRIRLGLHWYEWTRPLDQNYYNNNVYKAIKNCKAQMRGLGWSDGRQILQKGQPN